MRDANVSYLGHTHSVPLLGGHLVNKLGIQQRKYQQIFVL